MKRALGLFRCRRGASALEFGMVAPIVITALLTIVGAGLLTWGVSSLYGVAALSARCGALGVNGTTTCTTTSDTTTYAVNTASSWLFSGVISAANVTATASVATCKGVSGNFYQVAISSTKFSTLPPPLSGFTISVSACYPRST